MADLAGTTAAQMAAAPLAARQERKASTNAIMRLLGAPSFIQGDGKKYKRQTGWGANKKDHPDGGTNETAAFVVFRPIKGLTLPFVGRIYCERFVENGKNKRVYSISFPFINAKFERLNADSNAAVENMKAEVRDAYREWLKTDGASTAPAVTKASDDKWEESDE